MKKLLVLLFSIFFLISPSVFAINVTLSCEAGKVSGNIETLKPRVYKNNIFPTIIINSQKKELSYFYLENEMKWDENFEILNENDFQIIALNLDNNSADLFFYNKKEKTFSTAFVGITGNVTYYGKCFN
jgi:hypothetical protein